MKLTRKNQSLSNQNPAKSHLAGGFRRLSNPLILLAFWSLVAAVLLAMAGCGGDSGKAVEIDPGPGASRAKKLSTKLEGADKNSFLHLMNRDHFAFVSIDVPAVVNDPQMKEVPWSQFFKGAIEDLGEPLFEVDDVRRMVWLMDSGFFEFEPGDMNPSASKRKSQPGLVIVIEHKGNFDQKKIAEQFAASKVLSPIELNIKAPEDADALTKQAWGNETTKLGVMLVGEKQLVVGSLDSVKKMAGTATVSILANHAVDVKFDKQVTGLMIFQPIRPSLRKQLGMAKMMAGQLLTPEQKRMFDLPDVTESIQFSLDFSDDQLCNGKAVFEDEKNALSVAGQLRQVLTAVSAMGGTGMPANGPPMPEGIPQPMLTPTSGKLMMEVIPEITGGGMQLDQQGAEILVTIRQTEKTRQLVSAMVSDMNREIELAQRIEALAKLGDAFKAYYVENESYPAAVPEVAEGQHPFSWRVEILPYLGHQALYDQFKKDEPWDSEHNLKIAEQIPEEFQRFAKGSDTWLHLPGGVGPFVAGKKLTNEEITDDIGETILVVEVSKSQAEPWTKPGSYAVQEDKLFELGQANEHGILALMVDGQVRIPSRAIGDKLLGMFTIAGGERITSRQFIRRQ